MCGIAGIAVKSGSGPLDARLDRMLSVESHRGPDGCGRWSGVVGKGYDVALGHARLAVIDLSPAGAQPMTNRKGNHVLSYNGEIYNYIEVRQELEALGVQFLSSTDSEVLLQALITWGPSALERLNGMWAFAWLDLDLEILTLSRDRFGEKPLYVYRSGEQFFFASEIKSILKVAGRKFSVNPRVVHDYAVAGLLDATDETFFEGIDKVEPGVYIQYDLAEGKALRSNQSKYWYPQTAEIPSDPIAAVGVIRETVLDAVRIRLRSDVPVGILLSGGLDSSVIAAAASRSVRGELPVRTFSVVTSDEQYSEEVFIDRVSSALELESNKIHLPDSGATSWSELPEATWFNDEPVLSFSTVSYYMMMQQARELGVTVLLSGQGADEIFCGYRKFLAFHLESLIRRGHYGEALRCFLGFVRSNTVLSQLSYNEAKRYLPRFTRASSDEIIGPALSDLPRMEALGLGGMRLPDRQLKDLDTFSVPSLTHYEDRMSMSAGREVRQPFLDHRLVQYMLSSSSNLKLRNGWTKWALREAFREDLPADIIWRKDKQGFIGPQERWLRSDLRPQLTEFLNDDLLVDTYGLLNGPALRSKYVRFSEGIGRGRLVGHHEIFRALALEVWLRKFSSYLAPP